MKNLNSGTPRLHLLVNKLLILAANKPELKKGRSHRLISWVEIPLGYFSDHVSWSHLYCRNPT